MVVVFAGAYGGAYVAVFVDAKGAALVGAEEGTCYFTPLGLPTIDLENPESLACKSRSMFAMGSSSLPSP